ncbi:MAG: 3-hydroxyacyl-CoA dehydrogenase family protein, partial [Thermoguttaceae bacterium]
MFSFDELPDPKNMKAGADANVRAMTAWKDRAAALASGSQGDCPIRSVGIIGAGTMGAELSAAHLKRRLMASVFDENPSALDTIRQRTLAELGSEGNNSDWHARVERQLRPVDELAVVAKCDLIIESITEKLSAKQSLFSELRKFLRPETIVASNTSTIPLTKLAESIGFTRRFCGMHFFHPVRRRPLVEIVCASETATQTIGAAVSHAMRLEKTPIVVVDGPGFLVNRLLLPYLTEGLQLVIEGAAIERIEQAALDFGMDKGPFRLMDEIGLDTTLHAGWTLADTLVERIAVAPLLVAFIKSGRLGQKSQAGFFSYTNSASDEQSSSPDPEAMELIAPWIKSRRDHSA